MNLEQVAKMRQAKARADSKLAQAKRSEALILKQPKFDEGDSSYRKKRSDAGLVRLLLCPRCSAKLFG